MLISRQKLESTIHYIPGRSLVYLNNAKVACSTIKKSIWLWAEPDMFSEDRGPHDRLLAPFSRNLEAISLDMDDFLQSAFFSVVRNPYVRILSAYLDKVGNKPRDTAVWQPFARRHRLPGDHMPSFGEFLRMVISDDPSVLDQHFAPQHINTLQRFVTCDFIGHIEQMDGVVSFLAQYGITVQSHTPHLTRARTSVSEFYGREEIKMVCDYYSADFEKFGYSDDPTVTAPVKPASITQVKRDLLKNLIQAYTAPHRDGRRRCIAFLLAANPDLLADFNSLEAGTLTLAELKALGDQAIRGEISNWKLVSRIGQEMLEYDMVYEAASVIHRARLLMHGS